MSWLSGLANKAEDLLNKVDQSAAKNLSTTNPEGPTRPTTWEHPQSQTDNYSPFLSQTRTFQDTTSTTSQSSYHAQGQFQSMSVSASVPSNLYHMTKDNGGTGTNAGYLSQTNHGHYSSMQSKSNSNSGTQSPANPLPSSTKKDKDEELFEFLNSPESTVDTNKRKSPATMMGGGGKSSTFPNGTGRHSRQSSTSSTTSTRSGKTPDPSGSGGAGTPRSFIAPDTQSMHFAAEKIGKDYNDGIDHSSIDILDDLGNNDSSSGYHSNQEDNNVHQQQMSTLELENQLLKSEVASLNQEMSSIIGRAKGSQDELKKMQYTIEQQSQQLSHYDQIIRELRSHENDMQEALNAKDSQLAILRVRFEDADKELEGHRRTMDSLQTEKDRILQDHTSSSGMQSQAFESVKQKLSEAEDTLRHEQENHRKAQDDMQMRVNQLEMDHQSLSDALATAQKKLNAEKVRYSDMGGQLKTAKSQAEAARQELGDYKEKATRILQSKDKLIASLKEGTGGGNAESMISQAELEESRQERDLLREELQKSRMTMDNLRTDLSDLEVQLQQEIESAQDQGTALEEQLGSEKRRREDAEHEIARQKQELQFAHEEALKQKTALSSRLQDREVEIDRLRNQLTARSASSTSETELENRLHSLTESLIQKQTMLEALSTEKNSLGLQLERLEKQYREAEAAAIRTNLTSVHMTEDEDVRPRVPGFMRESAHDGDVARRLKGAANTIDRFSVRLGVFLRRYPIARVFVIIYMFLLHLWVMIVLFTYQPEMHGADYNPHPPPGSD